MNPKRAREEQKQAGDQAPCDQPPKLLPEGIFFFFGYIQAHRSGKPITERLRCGRDCLFLLRELFGQVRVLPTNLRDDGEVL